MQKKNMSMVRERGMSIADILTYDLLPTCPLFEGDFPTEAKKSKLITEIAPPQRRYTSKWDKTSDEPSAIHVDFMSRVRRQPFEAYATLGELITGVLNSASTFCTSAFVHLLLDSYIEFSLKEPERMRRCDGDKGIDIVDMTAGSPTPQQKDLFWASDNNKTNLQKLLREIAQTRSDTQVIFLSSMIEDGELLPAIQANGDPHGIPELTQWIEEADDQIIIHVNYSVNVHKIKRQVVLSNDTDTFVLLLRHTPHFLSCGATEIWLSFGIGENERMIPMHEVSKRIGPAKSLTMIKAHIITGGDIHSKVGTKHAAVKTHPEKYLSSFGETPALSEQDISLAEEYLIKVTAGVMTKTRSTTFDAYRREKYTGGSTGINDLPPTSSAIRTHIHRASYSVYIACSLLDQHKVHLDPREYGWETRFGVMLPVKSLRPLPPKMRKVCGCRGRCDRKTCKCIVARVSCIVFCHEKATNDNCCNTQA